MKKKTKLRCGRFKVIVLGESGAGKTSLIYNLSKNWNPAPR
jgi:GTPase SAR1 family protein